MFRAYAITRMEEAGYGRAAVWAPWAVFTVLHLYQGPVALLVIGAVAGIFVWLYRWKRSIWPVMVAHALYDLTILLTSPPPAEAGRSDRRRPDTVAGMQVDVRHSPSFAVARVVLDPNEQLKAESGAMMAMSAGMGLQSSTQGGVMKGLKRSVLGGESLFISTYTAPANGGWIDVAHHLTGDIIVAGVLPDQPMNVTKGCWLASSMSRRDRHEVGRVQEHVRRRGRLPAPRPRPGTIVLACYGALDTINLQPGEQVTIDSGHVVAYGPTVQSQLRKAATGLMQTLKSGEGFVFDFVGPGWIMTQSRNPSALEAWIRQVMPGQTGGAGGGMLGNVLGR